MNERRFEFGQNWRRFLATLGENQIEAAVRSLQTTLGRASLTEQSFLDIGCGSGLFSLAARKLGAKVRSFDFDEQSVACARELKDRYFPGDENWQIETGSVLDRDYLTSLGKFDVVYSWGVLHHTGAMKQAWEGAAMLVQDNGRLCLSIYNDQGYVTRCWGAIKRTYQRLPEPLRPGLVLAIGATQFLRRLALTLAAAALRLLSLRDPSVPIRNWYHEVRQTRERGMHRWRDLVDWVGGYPFEVARPEEVFNFFRARGFELVYLTTQGSGHGCNEFVFVKSNPTGEAPPPTAPRA